ncbi:MAG: quinolinate synthase NadA [Methanobrevibacter sp.]|jgi:quinolinate synthase|uniref:quinolinate synthase NadA n=1 Tax=Methanobrevibacter sp. TaxID=66852 RepID=UPI0025EC3ED5|nr:quinolinate synthase NadA [Methanobrevibacter sp.]MBE6497743.1 quinolinate synthase NadA [Methanobrevibacter sp.]
MSNSLQEEILKLKDEKNAIILAHNYQPKEIQEIADFLGDSLELCIKASKIDDKDLVIFCGVDFMAETAFILNPDKKIVIPTLEAECPMAHMLPEDVLLEAKKEHPDAGVILYVNSIAEAKQHADTLCTSANAVKVTESLPHDKILFGPDKNLGTHVAEKLDKEIIHVPKDGHCYVHRLFHVEDIELKREQHPNAEVICHPECNINVQNAADKVMSTGGMLKYIAESDKEEFIIGTEVDMITRINAEVPGKKLYPLLEGAICETMKLHTLEKVRDALVNEEPQVTLPKDVAEKSRKAVEHMLNAS